MQRPVIRLYSNRSACFVKLKKFDKVGLAGPGESWVKRLHDVWYSKHYTREGDRYGFNSRAVCFAHINCIARLLNHCAKLLCADWVKTKWIADMPGCRRASDPFFCNLKLGSLVFRGTAFLGPHGRHWQMQRNVPHWSQNGPRLVGTTHVGCSSSEQLFVIR